MFGAVIMNPESAISDIFTLYEKHGADDYIGEAISQIEHACQCAQLAEKDAEDEEVVLAAFFHDLGHICPEYGNDVSMGGYGHQQHEKLGADFLRERGFSEKIVRLVESHVQAKRYLCTKPEYYRKLSDASRETLKFQGGPMKAEEINAFENNPLFHLSIKLRAWDEAAKEENVPLPDLNIYREMARKHLNKRQ